MRGRIMKESDRKAMEEWVSAIRGRVENFIPDADFNPPREAYWSAACTHKDAQYQPAIKALEAIAILSDKDMFQYDMFDAINEEAKNALKELEG